MPQLRFGVQHYVNFYNFERIRGSAIPIIRSLTRGGKTLRGARRYVCPGCWDGDVDSVEIPGPANCFSLVRIFEVTLYPDPEREKEAQVQFERIDDCASFEEVRDTICRNIFRVLSVRC